MAIKFISNETKVTSYSPTCEAFQTESMTFDLFWLKNKLQGFLKTQQRN